VIDNVCLRSLSPAFVVAFLSLLVLLGGSLAFWFCLSDPRAALVRNSGVIGVSVTAVLIVARMSVFVCLPGGRSFGAAVGFVLSAPQRLPYRPMYNLVRHCTTAALVRDGSLSLYV
jgi:hypothetical protein